MRRGLFLLAMLLVLPGFARADDLYVNCAGGPLDPGEYATINDALNLGATDPHRDYRIYITGTCIEKINLYRRSGISFIGQDDLASVESPAPPNAGIVFNLNGAQFITIQRLNIRNGTNGVSAQNSSTVTIDSCTIENSTFGGIQANSNSNVYIGSDPASAARGVSINGSGGAGIFATESLVEIRGHTTIENNTGNGISLNGGRLRLRAVNTENLIRNNASGIGVGSSASASIEGQNTIQNNTFMGVIVTGSSASFNEVVRASDGDVRITTIEGHPNSGLTAAHTAEASLGGRHKIRNNGATTAPTSYAGVRIFNNSTIQMGNGVEVSGNTGPGVLADASGVLVVVSPITITGNSQEGVRLTLLSAAKILISLGQTVSTINSITCDETSALTGAVTMTDGTVSGEVLGVGTTNCSKIGAAKTTK